MAMKKTFSLIFFIFSTFILSTTFKNEVFANQNSSIIQEKLQLKTEEPKALGNLIYSIEEEFDPTDVSALKSIRDNSPENSSLRTKWANDANVGSWEGVSWNASTPKKVRQLSVQNCYLKKLNVSGLASLETLYCNSNNLEELVTTGLLNIKTIYCSDNKLAFSRLPLPSSFTSSTNYIYSPQRSLYEERTIASGETIDYSFESIVNGKSTSFTWFRDNIKIDGTDQSGKFSPSANGYYNCVMTNQNFPNLTITTSSVKVGDVPEFYKTDVEVLKSIRDNAPIGSSLKKDWADENAIETWLGVTWTDQKSKRVKALLLQSKGLIKLDVAALPLLETLDCGWNSLQMLNITGLKNLNTLYCQNNNLTSIDLTGVSSLKFMNCSNNSIPFSKLPIRLPVYNGSYTSNPQNPIFEKRSITLGESIDFSSEAIINGQPSTFYWYCSGLLISNTNQTGKYTPSAEGVYYCKVKSYYFTGFYETTNLVTVGNPSEFDANDVTILKSIRDNSPQNSTLKTLWVDDAQVGTWAGVTWSQYPAKRVTYLDLSYKRIDKLDVRGLTFLDGLSCQHCGLISLNATGLNNLKYLTCTGNNLKFSTLHFDQSLPTKDYSPQELLDSERSIELGETIDYSSEAIIDGEQTQFTWYKDNIKIEGTDQSGKLTPQNPGSYTCSLINAKFPLLVLKSNTVKLGTTKEFDQQDINALLKIRDNAPEDSPLKNLWKDETSIGSWSGVVWDSTISPKKVKSLNLNNQKLKEIDVSNLGSLTELFCFENSLTKLDLSNLPKLNTINCYHNNLKLLNINGLTNLYSVDCSSNRLSLTNLPLANYQFGYFRYYNQLPSEKDTTINVGTTIDFSSQALIKSVKTVFTWYRNNEKISGTDNSGKYTTTQDGYYYCTMYNSTFPSITITSNIFKIGQLDTFFKDDVETIKAIRDNAPPESPLKTLWADDSKMATWQGIQWTTQIPYRIISLTVSSQKLKSLDLRSLSLLKYLYCDDNNLESLDVRGLTNLLSLSCGRNKLVSLDLTGADNLSGVKCWSNKIPFSKLPSPTRPAFKYGSYEFNSQTPFDVLPPVKKGELIDFSSESLINGVATKYTWYLGDMKLFGTDQSGRFTPSEDGYYSCTMTNGVFSDLVIKTGQVKCGEPVEISTSDIDALKAIRDGAPAGSPLKSLWGDDSKILTWEGVTWNSFPPKRVIGLNITKKMISTLDVSKLTYLEKLNCSDNDIQQLDITLTRISSLDCRNNRIPFSKLLIQSNGNNVGLSLNYNPQNPIFDQKAISIGEPIDFSSESLIGEVSTEYTWFRNDAKITNTNQSGKYIPTEDGVYYCSMINLKFGGVVLVTNKITVGNPSEFDPQDVAALKTIRDKAPDGARIKLDWADDKMLSSWSGVTWSSVKPKRVISLYITYLGLKVLDVSAFSNLESLYCNNNELTTLDLTNLTKLKEVNCSNNFLAFSKLSVRLLLSLSYYTYYPQGVLYQPQTVNIGQPIDYSSEVLIDGVSTVYTWYKNNIKIENTNQTGIYTPISEGYYYCVMTNSKFPKLTLTTNAVKVGNPPEYDPQDILLLKSIRDKAPANSFLKTLWAVDGNIGSWQGVTWSQFPTRQVKELNLNGVGLVSLDLSGFNSLEKLYCPNNNLISIDLGILPALITADCSNNRLTSLNIKGLTKLESLSCGGNNLRFSDLPLTLPVKNYTYYYSYQTFPEVSGPVEVGKVFDYSSEAIIDGVQTKFEWFRNGVLIPGTDISGKYKASDEGFYCCRMTNFKFPDLTLTTNQVKVGAVQEYYQEDVEALKAIRDNASANSNLKSLWRDESQIVSWFGVVWSYTLPHRVIQLSVGNMELTQLDVSKLTALTQLSCYSNKLKSINITGLSNLQNFSCNNNLLSSIDVSTNRNLQGLDCSSNLIPFSELPYTLPAGYGSINYSNQKPFSEEKSLTLGQTIDYSSEAVINGTSSSFTWFRNNLKIEGTDNSGKYTPVSDGFYYCTMSNPKFTGLVITTGKTIVGSPIEFNPDDIAALKSIRDNSPSDSPLRTSWADDIPVKDWRGITWNSVYPLRVEKLIVAAMRLNTLDVSLLTKLKYLDCTFNKLNKLDVSILPELSTLYCSNNQLDEIKIDKAQKISNLSCEYNRLSLSKLPLPTSLMISYRYSPQNTLYDERTINPGEIIDYSSEATIDGTSTVFTWFKDNSKIENTDQTGKYAPTETGFYYCQMANSKFVGLTITTNFLKLGTPSEYDSRDISVLKSIRDSAPENSQLKTIWANDLPIENWLAINWSSSRPKRVIALLLNGIQLTALDVTGLNELKTLNCSQCGLLTLKASGQSNLSSISCNDNQLSTLDFSGNSRLTYINISNNKLAFSKIPLISGYYYTFIYSPQKEIFDAREIKLGESIDFSSEADIRGYQTNFTWYKDEVAITTIQSGTFTPTESGTYCCKMTNYAYQNLTLVTNKITVTSTSEFEVADANALKAIRNAAPASSPLKTEWADETQMATWKGVTWTESVPKRVNQLDVSNKNISSLQIGTLSVLESLNCSNNQITSLNVDGLNKLNNLDCSFNLLTSISVTKAPKIQNLTCNNNNIPFSSLPLSLPVSAGTYRYSPMNKIDSERTILFGESINYILESKIGGIATVFSWFKNDVKVTDSDQSGKYTPADIGIFYCTMTNDKFPGLVITTSKINIIKPEVYDLADIEALKRLRDNLPLDSPLRLKWKDDNQIFSWEGVGWGSNSPRKINVLQMSSAGLKTLDLTSFANLEQIYCDNNQLTSIKLTGLLNLNYISCAYNQLTVIDISGLPKIKNLFCQNNKLCFSKLPVKLSVIGGNYQYWPQQIVFEEQTIPLGGTIDFSSEKIINGIATVFTWYKNNSVISGTDQTGKLVTSGDGFYHCVMTNANFPGLTLTTNKVNTGTIYEFDPNDVKVLTTILDNAPAISNVRSNWKDLNQIGSWYGVKWNNETPRRVTELDVSNAGLTTLNITNLDKLERLNFANNRLASVKFTGLQHLKYINADYNMLNSIDLSGLSEMQLLTCPKNNLTLSSLWTNKSYLNYPGAYAPQNLIYTEKTILLGETIDYSSEAKIGGVTTTFTWYRNNEKIDNTDNSGKYIPTTDGYYYCSMTNSNFPDLTLFTSAVKVGAPIRYNLQDVETLKAIRNNAPESSLLKSKWGDETKIGSWEGVIWSSFYPKYVVELAIHDQIINLDVTGLSNLQSLNICACYVLESVNVSGLKKLTSIDCRYNKIPFSKLPLNTSTLSCFYNPQYDLYNELTLNLGEAIDYSSEKTIDGIQTVYKWFYNGTEITGTDQTGKYKPTATGEYYCTMTNTKFPELVLKTNKVTIGDKIPVANAGADQVVKEGSVVYLDGTSSTSGGNENLTYLWTSPSDIILSSNTIPKPVFTAPEVSTDTKFTFSLVVNNGSFSSNADQVIITVQNENKAPVANAGSHQEKNEGETINLDGSASYDPDGDALIYQWSSPQGISLSSTSDAKPSFKAPEVSGDTSYTFTLTVSDGKLNSVKSEVTVLVKNNYPKVKLIAKLDNSAIPATTLKYQFYSDNNGAFTEVIQPFEIKGDTTLVSLYPGKWVVLVSSTQSPALFVPTYLGNVLTWNQAEQISLQGKEHIIREVNCIKTIKPINGSGEISGFIVETDKVSTKSISIFNGIVDDKKPVSGAIINLYRKGDESPVLSTVSDLNGYYKFENLQILDYDIVVEIPGFTQSDRFAVTISNAAPSTSIQFAVNTNTKVITDVGSIDYIKLNVYPNPVSDILYVDVEDLAEKAILFIYNINGELICSKVLMQPKTIVNFTEQASGSYIVRVFVKNQFKQFVVLKNY